MNNAPTETDATGELIVEKAVYGGDGLARTPSGEVVFIPFVLPGERVKGHNLLQASPERVAPACVHFGTCGGCQYQMASYPEQLRIKAAILRETLERAGLEHLPEMHIIGSPEPYGYRNRIRLRVREVDGFLRLGYNQRGSRDFLPVSMCPIAAPALWSAAEALGKLAGKDRDAAEWLRAAAEVEISGDAGLEKLQVHLLCSGKTPSRQGGFARFAEALARAVPVTSAGASYLHVPSGRALEQIASWGADGIAYRVGEDSFWLRRGSFFQVNRLLLSQLAELVCEGCQGELAWDLFAGVGLFARRLTRHFTAVTAVEASPVALTELRRGLRRTDQAIQETTLAFLRTASLQRERPELVVLDPPRAGAGEEACKLLTGLAPAEIVYVSCDPTTLGRDVQVFRTAGYCVAELHMIDLFPQTYHLETVMVLRRQPVAP